MHHVGDDAYFPPPQGIHGQLIFPSNVGFGGSDGDNKLSTQVAGYKTMPWV